MTLFPWNSQKDKGIDKCFIDILCFRHRLDFYFSLTKIYRFFKNGKMGNESLIVKGDTIHLIRENAIVPFFVFKFIESL